MLPEHKFPRRRASCQGTFIYLLLGNSLLNKAKTGKFACYTGNSLGEGGCPGTTGNRNSGVPVVLKSCLLVLGGENVHFHVFKVHMKV